MFWADRVAKEIISTGRYKPYWVDDMKTPSGRIHVGSLRGVVVHDLIYKALLNQKVSATFTYVFEDHDPMDEVSADLDRERWSKYLGQPLFTVPSPDGEAENFAVYFSSEFEEIFRKINCHPEIIWMSKLYKAGKMNADIKICLDKAPVIRKIYEKMYKKKLPQNWYPFQAVCPNCGKESTTKVTDWDGEKVTFTCQIDAVAWTHGCGMTGEISPFSNREHYTGKLPWKVEWAVKWKVIGVTVEGAGKDHMSAGGSHDISKLICEKVINYPTPYPFAYEFFLINGRKMSSSKGLGSSAKEVAEIIPPYLLRFLMVRTQINQAIDFNPSGWTIPDLFDEYDRCWRAYVGRTDQDLYRVFELSQIGDLPGKKKIFLPRFRDVANYIQLPNVNVVKKFEEIKGNKLTDFEKNILDERVRYAKVWVDNYAPSDYRIKISDNMPQEVTTLSKDQKEYLALVSELLDKDYNPVDLQLKLYNEARRKNIDPQNAFSAIYISLLGKTHGPKAAWFLLSLDRNFLRRRFEEVQTYKGDKTKKEFRFQILRKPSLFYIEREVKRRFATINVGIAIIKDVKISNNNSELNQEIKEFISKNSSLTTREIGLYPEIQSYRKIYRETGVDWHSKRSSPEALLRRIALGKGATKVNTCVDAYNLVVMKHQVSAGAFNFDEIKFPTVLRFAKAGDYIHMIGEKKPTFYNPGEIAYFDQKGGYNIDFNYRDAIRTAVDEKSKNLWINCEGVFDISREQVERTLQETIDIILKYCGGKLEIAGIVAAS